MPEPAQIVLPPFGPPVDQLWHALLDLAESLPATWTLVGGQMVLLHALEHGRSPAVVSQDGDVVADLRADQEALATLDAELEERGFELAGISTDGVGHRYVRGAPPVMVDVLAPEGLGPRTRLTTTPPGRTVQVPGGSQALDRTELVTVTHEGRTGHLPRPSLLAAIVSKSAVCGLPQDRSRHFRDLALLCTLVDDPITMRDELTAKDRQRLRLSKALENAQHAAWLLITGDEDRLRGQATHQLLSMSP